jgi:hypothetical protein
MGPREFVERGLVRDAVVTMAVIFMAYAALDDITTDSAVSFPVERTALVLCVLWFSMVAWRLWQHGHRVLGAVSFGFVTIAAMIQPWIGRGMAPTPYAYLATFGTLAWFLFVAGALALFAWQPRPRHAS